MTSPFKSRELVIGPPRISERDDWKTISASVRVGRRTHDITYRTNAAQVSANSDFLLASTLVPAMARGFPISLESSVSGDLMERIPRIQEAYSSWRPHLKPVPVRATGTAATAPRIGNEVGCFFSGGVDSFYTLFANISEVTKIIYIHGLDVFLYDEALREKVSASLQRISKELGKEIIEVETDIRDAFSDFYTVPRDNSGSLMISTALLLAPQFRKIFIASPPPLPLPDTGKMSFNDPSWSTAALELVHHGANVSRTEKVKAIGDSKLVAETLRVCYTNISSGYNCGSCEKCVRTMADLRANGQLDKFTVFDVPLSLQAVSRLALAGSRSSLEDTLAALRRDGSDPELAAAIESSLRGGRLPTVRTLVARLFYLLNGFHWWIPLQVRLLGGHRRRLKIRSLVNSLLHR